LFFLQFEFSAFHISIGHHNCNTSEMSRRHASYYCITNIIPFETWGSITCGRSS
jgi:hypothetical protein